MNSIEWEWIIVWFMTIANCVASLRLYHGHIRLQATYLEVFKLREQLRNELEKCRHKATA